MKTYIISKKKQKKLKRTEKILNVFLNLKMRFFGLKNGDNDIFH
jgi:hypothetical protein